MTAAQQSKEQQEDGILTGQTGLRFVRRRNSPLIRSRALVVRSAFHCVFGKRRKVNRSSPASSRHSTTAGESNASHVGLVSGASVNLAQAATV